MSPILHKISATFDRLVFYPYISARSSALVSLRSRSCPFLFSCSLSFFLFVRYSSIESLYVYLFILISLLHSNTSISVYQADILLLSKPLISPLYYYIDTFCKICLLF